MAPLAVSANVAIGHHVLPGIGLAHLAVGGGSLSVAATSVLASGGILALPTIALYCMVDRSLQGDKNAFARKFLKAAVVIGSLVGNFFLAAELFGIKALPLFLKSFSGGLTGTVFVVGLVLAVLTIALAVEACKNCSKNQKSYDEDYSSSSSGNGLGLFGSGDSEPRRNSQRRQIDDSFSYYGAQGSTYTGDYDDDFVRNSL